MMTLPTTHTYTSNGDDPLKPTSGIDRWVPMLLQDNFIKQNQ